MKKAFLLALLATGTQAAQAQSIPAGTISLGGNVGYNRSTAETSSSSAGGNGRTISNKTTYSQFSISPAVGYFVVDNLAVGLDVGYSSFSAVNTNTPSSGNGGLKDLDPRTQLQLGAFAKYYQMLTEQFGFTGTLRVGYQNTRYQEYEYDTFNSISIYSYQGSGVYAGLTPGIVFFPIPKLGLNASIGAIGYNRMNFDYPTTGNRNARTPQNYDRYTSDFGANFGLSQLQFGGTYYFGR